MRVVSEQNYVRQATVNASFVTLTMALIFTFASCNEPPSEGKMTNNMGNTITNNSKSDEINNDEYSLSNSYDSNPPCQSTNQRDLDDCEEIKFKRSNQEMKRLYILAINGLSRNESTKEIMKDKKQLEISQNLFLKFRQANCYAQYLSYEGGTIAPSIESSCKREITNWRIADLKQIYKLP